jgi:RNA polymerase sigma-70 factor (family 1)
MVNLVNGREESLLVRELVKGNLLAFNSLFREYSNRLFCFAFGYLKSQDEAEELVQEVFTIIWEKRANLNAELSFKSYLFTISFNIIRKHFRTKSYLIEYLRYEKTDEQDLHTSDEISYNSLYHYITRLVDQLPERRKLIFIKSRFEGLSIREIAEELNISHKTVENQLTDALKFMRANLNRESIFSLFFCIFFYL